MVTCLIDLSIFEWNIRQYRSGVVIEDPADAAPQASGPKRQRTWPAPPPSAAAPSRAKRPAPAAGSLSSRLHVKRARSSQRLESVATALAREAEAAAQMSRKGEAFNGSAVESSESSGPEVASRARGHHARGRERVRRALAEVAYSSEPKQVREALSFLFSRRRP